MNECKKCGKKMSFVGFENHKRVFKCLNKKCKDYKGGQYFR